MVGMVVTISPSFNLYKMVVFPAASRPTIKILISFFANSILTSRDIATPMAADQDFKPENFTERYELLGGILVLRKG